MQSSKKDGGLVGLDVGRLVGAGVIGLGVGLFVGRDVFLLVPGFTG